MDRQNRHGIALLIITLLFAAGNVFALDEAIREAQKCLDKNEADAALKILKEAQIDQPEAPELRFGIACAQYVKGETLSSSGAAEEAQAAFKEARVLFDGLALDQNIRIARESVFNSANTLAREALNTVAAGDHKAGIAALRQAVTAYQAGLDRFPGHEGMRQNLDHVSLKLKELLQNPQSEEQKQDQQPPEDQPGVISLFGQAATEVPGAEARTEENTAILVLPEKPEQQEQQP